MNRIGSPNDDDGVRVQASEALQNHAGGSAVCPECGTPKSQRTAPPPDGFLHAGRLIPLFCAGAAWLAWLGVSTWTAQSGLSTIMPNSARGVGQPFRLLVFVQPRVTVADLQTLADGFVCDFDLCESILAQAPPWLEQPPGPDVLWARFTNPDGWRTESKAIGWPMPWVIQSESRDVSDVFDPRSPPGDASGRISSQGPIPLPPERWRWMRGTLYHSWHESLYHTHQASYSLPAMALTVVMLIFAYVIGTMCAGVLAWVVRRMRQTHRKPTRRWSRLCGVASCLLLAACIFIFGHSEESTTAWASSAISSMTSFMVGSGAGAQVTIQRNSTAPVQVDLDAVAIRDWAAQPHGDRAVASSLLEIAADVGAPDDACLSVTFEQQTARTAHTYEFGWPIRVLRAEQITRSWINEDGTLTPAYWPPGPTRWRFLGGWFSCVLGTSTQTDHRIDFMIDPAVAAVVVFGLWLVWALVAIAWRAGRRARVRRRLRAGRCVACGYLLVGHG